MNSAVHYVSVEEVGLSLAYTQSRSGTGALVFVHGGAAITRISWNSWITSR